MLIAQSCNHPSNNPQIVRQLFVHKYGVGIPQSDWLARGSNGQIVTTYRDGTTVSRNYTGGTLHGTTTYTFPHSTIIQKTEIYEEGTLVRIVSHYPSGIPHEEIIYLDNGHVKKTVWYEDGTPQSVEELLDGKVLSGEYFTPSHELEARVQQGEGTRVQRDAYGNLSSKETIQSGEMVLQILYYPNGVPEEMSSYKDGVLDGERKTFHFTGEPNVIEEWSCGYQHGTTVLFQNGQKCSEISYIRGKKQGLEKRYDDNGHLVEEITWVDGKKHGPSRLWIDGIAKTEWFIDNQAVTQIQYNSPRHVH